MPALEKRITDSALKSVAKYDFSKPYVIKKKFRIPEDWEKRTSTESVDKGPVPCAKLVDPIKSVATQEGPSSWTATLTLHLASSTPKWLPTPVTRDSPEISQRPPTPEPEQALSTMPLHARVHEPLPSAKETLSAEYAAAFVSWDEGMKNTISGYAENEKKRRWVVSHEEAKRRWEQDMVDIFY